MTAAYWITGDTRTVVAGIPDDSIDLVVTSPPFLALRSYLPDDHPSKADEIGQEPGPAEFVDTLLELSAEWRRILAPHGSIAVELGDTFSGSGGAGGDYQNGGNREGQNTFAGSAHRASQPAYREGIRADGRVNGSDYGATVVRNTGGAGWPLAKSLALIPESYRIGLAYGRNPISGDESPAGRWRIRNVVRWVRPNPPVGALGDKFRPATSEMVIATIASDRWFDLDAVRTEPADENERPGGIRRGTIGGTDETRRADGSRSQMTAGNRAGVPPLDWWKISPGGFSGSHYAVFPPELVIRPILAMCPRRVCLTCGQPSRRVTEPEHDVEEQRERRARGQIRGKQNRDRADGGMSSSFITTRNQTIEWTTCHCPGTDGLNLDGFHTGTGWRPGRVLDPFGGSGTTGLVATGHGRDFVGIDIDEQNISIAMSRIGPMLMFTTTTSEIAEILA